MDRSRACAPYGWRQQRWRAGLNLVADGQVVGPRGAYSTETVYRSTFGRFFKATMRMPMAPGGNRLWRKAGSGFDIPAKRRSCKKIILRLCPWPGPEASTCFNVSEMPHPHSCGQRPYSECAFYCVYSTYKAIKNNLLDYLTLKLL